MDLLKNTRTKTTVTDYLKSEVPCEVCYGLNEKVYIEAEKNRSTTREIKDQMLQLCKNYDKPGDAVCSLIVKTHFNDLYNSHNQTSGCDFTCSRQKIFSFYLPVDAKRRPSPTPVPESKPLSIIDCNICEMVVGFAVEQGTLISTANTGKIFREQCKQVPVLKDHCDIFTDEIANKMVDHLLQNTHPFEMCTFFGYCP